MRGNLVPAEELKDTIRYIPSEGTGTLPHRCTSVGGSGVPTGSCSVSVAKLNQENTASWIHNLFGCPPEACLDTHPLAGEDQGEYSHWSQSQALRTQNKAKGKSPHTCGSPPCDKWHKRQRQEKKNDHLWEEKEQ